MATDPNRVTARHIHGLAAADTMRGGRTILADTDDGLRYVDPGAVFAAESTVRRLLLTTTELREDADAAGMTVAAYVRAHAAQIARQLNTILKEAQQ